MEIMGLANCPWHSLTGRHDTSGEVFRTLLYTKILTHTHIRKYTCTHTHTHTHIHTHTHTHSFVLKQTHTHTYAQTHTHTHTHTQGCTHAPPNTEKRGTTFIVSLKCFTANRRCQIETAEPTHLCFQ